MAGTIIAAGFLFGFSAGFGAIASLVVAASVKCAEQRAMAVLAKWWRQ